MGPIEVAVDAGSKDFQLYKSGVMNPPCGDMNHAVVAYGYDSDEQGNYVMIRNSWSANWGDRGNFKLRVNPSNKTCGSQQLAWLPFVQKKAPSPSPSPSPPPTPSNCPIFYEHCPLTGASITTCSSIKDLKTVKFANTVSSLKLVGAKAVQLFSDFNCMGTNIILNADNTCLAWDIKTEVQLFIDRSLSLAVSMNEPPMGCIWVFEDCCYSSGKQEICGDVADLNLFNFNDKISSIQFGFGVKNVVVFLDRNYYGIAFGLDKSHGCMSSVETKLLHKGISSLRIFK
jgi:hypothetical protein